jgi:hypothetical protein
VEFTNEVQSSILSILMMPICEALFLITGDPTLVILTYTTLDIVLSFTYSLKLRNAINIYRIQSNLISTTIVYTTPSILQHIFARLNFLVQNSLFYTTTTLDNTTFRACILSY